MEADFYFAYSYCSWQRGLNENTYGLIRQYNPKGLCFSSYDNDYMRLVQSDIGRKSGESINFMISSERFYASL